MFNCKVLIVGDIILDRFIYGHASRIAPEAPVPIVNMSSETCRLGGAANVAANMSSLGCQVHLVGAVGDDEAGSVVRSLLSEFNIDTCLTISGMTTVKTRIVADSQYVVRVDNEIYCEHDLEIPMIDCDAIMISDYAKGAINKQTMDLLPKIRTYIDPKPKNHRLYHSAYMMFPNKYEAGEMLRNGSNYMDLAIGLKSSFNLSESVVTLSEDGLILSDKMNKCYHIPAHKLSVVERLHKMDVTGAGDTLFSVFVASHCSGNSSLRSAVLANVAAAIVVNKIGTSTCSWDEIQREIAEQELDIQEMKDA